MPAQAAQAGCGAQPAGQAGGLAGGPASRLTSASCLGSAARVLKLVPLSAKKASKASSVGMKAVHLDFSAQGAAQGGGQVGGGRSGRQEVRGNNGQ